MTLPVILHDSRLDDDDAPTASTTAAGDFDPLNLRDWRTFSFWKPTVLPATVDFDAGLSSPNNDYMMIWGHDLGTQGATVELRRADNAAFTGDTLVASHTPTDDKPFALHFTPQSQRFWRLRFTGTTVPTIAIAAIGAKLEFPKRLHKGFDPTMRDPQGAFNISEKGQPLGSSVEFEAWEESLEFRSVSWDFIRNTWVPAWKTNLVRRPFAFLWDRTTYPDEIHLCQRRGRYRTPHSAGQIVDLRFDVMGLALP